MSFDDSPEGEPIPEVFHSFETGGPFERCSVCQGSLEGVPYMIEKAFSRGETIYEYAICRECHGNVREDLSRESKERIEGHLRQCLERRDVSGDPLSRCLVSEESLGEDYLIGGLFFGRSMVPDFPPFAISGAELERIQELLSKTTRERLDDFVDDVLGIPGVGNPVPMLV